MRSSWQTVSNNESTHLKVYVEDILSVSLATPTTESKTARAIAISNARLSTSRRLTQVTLLLSDVVALCTVVNAVLVATKLTGLALPEPSLLIPAFSLFLVAYAASGLYQPFALQPEQELLGVTKASLLVFCGLALPAAFVAPSALSLMLLYGIAGPLLILFVPFMRVVARIMFSRASWWGLSALVIGRGTAGREAVKLLKRSPELGVKPVALLQDDIENGEYMGIPTLSSTRLYRMLAQTHRIPFVVLAMEPAEESMYLRTLKALSMFDRVFVLRGDTPDHPVLVDARELDQYVEHWAPREPAAYQHVMKRGMDIIFATAMLIVFSPLLAAVSLMIKITSPGPLFFVQQRLGQRKRTFGVIKFRTMHVDAEQKLQEILRNDPVQRQEYEIFHKLRDDPRVTSIGKVLRRYSLDELPQLWNILMGDMSLVGPRAYIPSELPQMLSKEGIVLRCNPGLTGLWQVSGRNQLSFEERVIIDVNYRKDWSLALDYYILLKTIPVVLTGHGAS
jgi:Undecaprenyl-phosphate galactose phosphotransferase WbaP